MRKILTQLRGTNFCIRLARFPLSFVRQPYGPECTQWYETHQNISLGSNGVGRVHSLRKIPTRLCGTNFCTSSAHFPLSFLRQPNGPECTQIVRNAPKCQFRVQYLDRVRLLRKIPSRLRGTNFCTSSACLAPSFVRQPNGTECIQMVRNAPKRQFRVQWSGPGVFVVKNYGATSWHEHLH